MPRKRHSAERWFGWAFALSLVLHPGLVLLYDITHPPPVPAVEVVKEGKGRGLVMAIEGGIRCGSECRAEYPLGARIKLYVTPQEGSTFEGWVGPCYPFDKARDPLECEVIVGELTQVKATFGEQPKELEVEFLEDNAVASANLKVPDVAMEAEALIEPTPAEPVPTEEQQKTPPPPQPEKENMKAVEVPDQNEVAEAPADAQFLSDKNRDVAEQTRAKDTNLDRQSEGDLEASAPSQNKDEQVGGEDQAIAALEDVDTIEDKRQKQSGEEGQAIVKQPEAGEAGNAGDTTESGGVLSMRGIEGRDVFTPPEPQADKDIPGAGKVGRPGLKTQLSVEDYEKIVGADTVAEEVAVGKRKMSAKQGRWERKLGAIRSSLENFTPEVKPGNQTALKTRAAPFAVYIARMHRRIHELWGFGFLLDLDNKPAGHELNHRDLATKVEIVLNPDGTVDKTTIVTTSGVLAFDVAALDTIYTAAPFEPVPDAIRSGDGKAYVHWTLHRDERQCGTFGAEPFILDGKKSGPRDRGAAQPGMPGAAPPENLAGGATSGGAAAARATANLPAPDDPKALSASNSWLQGFQQGSSAAMLDVSGYPFRSGDSVVARSRAELTNVYGQMLGEVKNRRPKGVRLVSAAGYRKTFGNLPAGVESKGDELYFVLVLESGDRLVLELRQSAAGPYLITGLHQ